MNLYKCTVALLISIAKAYKKIKNQELKIQNKLKT